MPLVQGIKGNITIKQNQNKISTKLTSGEIRSQETMKVHTHEKKSENQFDSETPELKDGHLVMNDSKDLGVSYNTRNKQNKMDFKTQDKLEIAARYKTVTPRNIQNAEKSPINVIEFENKISLDVDIGNRNAQRKYSV